MQTAISIIIRAAFQTLELALVAATFVGIGWALVAIII